MPSEAVLGKRKRKPAQKGADADVDVAAPELEDAQAIFRRHFEAQFAPLEEEKPKSRTGGQQKRGGFASDDEEEGEGGMEDMRSDSESEEGDDDDEWGGLSGEEDSGDDESDNEGNEDAEADTRTNGVEIVDHSKPLVSTATSLQTAMMSKREMRAYLSSRPPDPTSTTATNTKSTSKGAGGDHDDPSNEDSKTLLANDLALQRLISESHILAASNPFNAIGSATAADAKAFTEGRTRKITTDLRLQKLGSKESIFTQQKMPMGMRKGINTAKKDRDDKRRREAKENGIILETAVKKGKKRPSGRGDVAVDMPGMGKFRNGELRLSAREVKAVEMDGKRFDSGKKRRRRR